MTRHDTDPGIGIEHEHDKHCQRCLVVLADCVKSANDFEAFKESDFKDVKDASNELKRKRADSEVRNVVKDQRARFWLKVLGLVTTSSVLPWVWKLFEWLGELGKRQGG